MNWIPLLVIAGVMAGFYFYKRMSLASPETARELIAKGALVVDVRTAGEFNRGNVPGAINIPLDSIERVLPGRVPDKSRPILLHCLSGARSGAAKSALEGMGYTNVHNLGSLVRAQGIVGGS